MDTDLLKELCLKEIEGNNQVTRDQEKNITKIRFFIASILGSVFTLVFAQDPHATLSPMSSALTYSLLLIILLGYFYESYVFRLRERINQRHAAIGDVLIKIVNGQEVKGNKISIFEDLTHIDPIEKISMLLPLRYIERDAVYALFGVLIYIWYCILARGSNSIHYLL